MTNIKIKKKQKLRNAEYYNLQETFDNLYADSKSGKTFKNLMQIITSSENIKMAYRNLKTNDGSYTAGVDKKNIEDIKMWDAEKLVKHIIKKIEYYMYLSSEKWSNLYLKNGPFLIKNIKFFLIFLLTINS